MKFKIVLALVCLATLANTNKIKKRRDSAGCLESNTIKKIVAEYDRLEKKLSVEKGEELTEKHICEELVKAKPGNKADNSKFLDKCDGLKDVPIPRKQDSVQKAKPSFAVLYGETDKIYPMEIYSTLALVGVRCGVKAIYAKDKSSYSSLTTKQIVNHANRPSRRR